MPKLLPSGALFVSLADGKSGAKFRSLRDGAEVSLASGFSLKPRIELRTGFFERFLSESEIKIAFDNGVEFFTLEGLANLTSWNSSEMRGFRQISADFIELSEPVLMVRANSTMTDSGGNGAYLSKAILNSPENIANAAKDIVLSFFSDKAKEIRKQSGLKNDELAIMVEPMVWDRRGKAVINYSHNEKEYVEVHGSVYAPVFSGIGKTSTPYGEPCIGMVSGLSFKYMDDPSRGLVIFPGQQRKTLDSILNDSISFNFNNRGSGTEGSDVFNSSVFMLPDGVLEDVHRVFFSQSYSAFDGWTSRHLFEMMESLKSGRGKDQYLEWSLVYDGQGKPVYYLNQRSDFEPPFFPVSGNVPAELKAGQDGLVFGAGKRQITHFARLASSKMCSGLHYVNENYSGYAISFDGAADNTILPNRIDLGLDDISKTACILLDENKDGALRFLEAHLGGTFGLTKKLAVAFETFDWDKIKNKSKLVEITPAGIEIYETSLVLEASEKGQRSLLYLEP